MGRGSAAAVCLKIAAACLSFVLSCSAQTLRAKAPDVSEPSALTITGLESLGVGRGFKSSTAELSFTDDTLVINAAGLPGPVTVKPWRKAWAGDALVMYKDKRTDGAASHSAQFLRRLQPYGVVQTIVITRSNATLPWLTVQTNALSGQKVLADWSVLQSAGRWWLQQQGNQAVDANSLEAGRVGLSASQPAALTVKGSNWCLYSAEKAQTPNEIALLDWVLLQQTGTARECR